MALSTMRQLVTVSCLLASGAVAQESCVRMVEVLPTRAFGRGLHEVQLSPPAAPAAQWFLTAAGDDPAWVELDGRVVLTPASLAGSQDRATRQVQLHPGSRLRVLVVGRHDQVTLRIVGVAPAAQLPEGLGTPAAEVQLLDQVMPAGIPARRTTLAVAAPGPEGVGFLRATDQGHGPLLLSRLAWNDEAVFGPTDLVGRHDAAEPVLLRGSNTLQASVLGRGAGVRVRITGWVTDATAPTGVWESPAEATVADASTVFRLNWSDTGTGVAGTPAITLNGQDITGVFTAGASSATASLAAFPPAALLAGENTLVATIRDRACNTTVVTRHFSVGGPADTTPPVVQQPANLVAEQTSPAGAIVTYPLPLATDDQDPAPVVTCVPPSGSTFPAGVSTVVCTARDQAGNVSSPVTFTVTVRDSTPPVLAQPANLVIEQQSPSGAVVSYPTPAAVDAADPTPRVVCTPSPGPFAPGLTVVTCVATDAAGNTSQPVTFQVLVRDTTAPEIAQPPNLTVEQTGPNGAVVDFATPTATDLADPAVEVTCVPSSGSVFPPGHTVVMCTAQDDAGNRSNTAFTVSVLDRTAPLISIASPASQALALPSTLLRITYSDVAGIDDTTLSVRVQGTDVTQVLTRTPGAAEALLGSLGLAEGPLDIEARIRDSAGNESLTDLTCTYQVPPAPVALQIEIPPAPGASLVLGQPYDLTLRAVTTAGDVAATFTGTVVLTTSDPGSLLNGLLVDFGPEHAGVRTLPGLAEFSSEGTHTVTATAIQGPSIEGSLQVEVVRSDRGRVLLEIPTGTYAPGQTIRARVLIDVGPSDDDPTTWSDVLGAYDLRVLYDPRQFQVVSVQGGSSPLGDPMFVRPGSVRLMDLNDDGSLSAPTGPNATASGLLEVATVDLLVRSNAPSGGAAFALVADALSSAEPADGAVLTPIGSPGPRLGEVQGAVTVASSTPSAGPLILGVLPRDGAGLPNPLSQVPDPAVVLSAPVDPTTLDQVGVLSAGQVVPGTVQLGDSATEVRFTPNTPLAPGEYTLVVNGGLRSLEGGALAQNQTYAFVVNPPAAGEADLDADGEIAVFDLQIRRDILLDRTPGALPDFPPLFLRGAPGTTRIPRVGETEFSLEVADPEGDAIALNEEDLPANVELTRTGAESFELTVHGSADESTLELEARTPAGQTGKAELRLVPERDNKAPGLVLVSALCPSGKRA